MFIQVSVKLAAKQLKTATYLVPCSYALLICVAEGRVDCDCPGNGDQRVRFAGFFPFRGERTTVWHSGMHGDCCLHSIYSLSYFIR